VEFPFSLKKVNESGALFDFVKLDSVSRDCVGRMSADEIYDATLEWAADYSPETHELLTRDAAYCKAVLNIERAGSTKVRKDIVRWSDVEAEVAYFFDDKFSLSREDALKLLSPISAQDIHAIVEDFKKTYDLADDKDAWFAKVKVIAEAHGFAADMKAYRAEPTKSRAR
jgi:glutamyl-tRNA synthetase